MVFGDLLLEELPHGGEFLITLGLEVLDEGDHFTVIVFG
jgi:hypothetical protein